MRWIKHLTSAGEDAKVSALIDEHGAEAYGIYWLLNEAIGLSMEKDSECCELAYSDLKWSQKLRCSVRKLRSVVQSMSNLGLIEVQTTSNRLTIAVPKLLKYRDEYSTKSGHSRNIDRERDTDGEGEGEKKTKKSGASRVRTLPAPDPIEKEIEEAASRIHIRHPKDRRCAFSIVLKNLRLIVHTHSKRHGMEKRVLLMLVEGNHTQSCESLDWLEEGGRFANSLEKWLCPSMDRYMTARARDSPRKQQPNLFAQKLNPTEQAMQIVNQRIERGQRPLG